VPSESVKPVGSPTLSSHRIIPFAAGFLLFLFALYQALATDYQRDFFIFRLGSEFAAQGKNPYDIAKIREPIAAHFTAEEEKDFVTNCGYFLPPMSVLVFMPFAMLPWVGAKVLWGVFLAFWAYFIARLPELLKSNGASQEKGLLWNVLPFLLVLNYVSLGSVLIGQYAVVFVGCVAAGLLAFERGRPYLAAILWVLPFVKPHLAIPLIPLAWYLGGWRPALLLVVLVGVLNAVGATIVGGSPLFLQDYVAFLSKAREAVFYNRVESNPTILSWNRLVYALTTTYAETGEVKEKGYLIELSAAGILAGYLVWFGLMVGKCALMNAKPSRAWVVAMTAVGGVLCAQVLVYESLFLLLAVPWVRDLFAGGYRIRGWLAVILLAVHSVPQKSMAELGIFMHHPLAVALFAVLVFTGPTDPMRRREESKSTSE
jgi:hypothetical protein